MSDSFHFAFITDPQIGCNSPFGLNARVSDRSRLESAIDYINDDENKIDFAIFGGDLVNRFDSAEELDIVMECLGMLERPYYGVSGNHDEGGKHWLEPEVSTESPYFDRGAPAGFSFTHEGASFLGLNALHLRGDLDEDLQQAEWEVMKQHFAAVDAAATHRFVVMHWPLLVQQPDEEETYWNMENRHELIAFFKANNVSCVLTGHYHHDIVGTWHGIPLLGSVGTSQVFHGPQSCAFEHVTVFPDGWMSRRVDV